MFFIDSQSRWCFSPHRYPFPSFFFASFHRKGQPQWCLHYYRKWGVFFHWRKDRLFYHGNLHQMSQWTRFVQRPYWEEFFHQILIRYLGFMGVSFLRQCLCWRWQGDAFYIFRYECSGGMSCQRLWGGSLTFLRRWSIFLAWRVVSR